MAYQRINLRDKVVERVLNDSLMELYNKTNYTEAKQAFKTQYEAASTTDEKLAVIAEYLGLT